MRPLPLLTALAVLAGLAACAPASPPAVLTSGGAAPTPAETACIAAVEGQISRTGVTVRASETTGAETRMTLDAPGAAAPWACVADASGAVRRVSYTGARIGDGPAGANLTGATPTGATPTG